MKQTPVPVSYTHLLTAGNLADIIIVLAFVGVRECKDGKAKFHAYLTQDVGKLHVSDVYKRQRKWSRALPETPPKAR